MTPWATARMVAVDSLRELCAARRADDALEDRQARSVTRLAEGHDDAGDDECGEELQQTDADARHEAEHRLREVADLRLHALHQRRQVGVRLRPERMQLRADDRPVGHGVTRRRDLERVGLHVVNESLHRVAQRTHEHGGRHNDQRDAENHDQRRGKPLPPADLAGNKLVHGIQRNGQDQCPQQQGQERRDGPVAQQRQGQHQADADEDIHEPGREALLEFGIGRAVAHGPGNLRLFRDGGVAAAQLLLDLSDHRNVVRDRSSCASCPGMSAWSSATARAPGAVQPLETRRS